MNSERDHFMWNEISTDDDVLKLMEAVCFFHDSCIKEMSYVSGAYVDVNLSMYPLNSLRVLRCLFNANMRKIL